MGSFSSVFSPNQKRLLEQQSFESNFVVRPKETVEEGSLRKEWKEQFNIPKGELECMLSGYMSYAEFMTVCETIKCVCEFVSFSGSAVRKGPSCETGLPTNQPLINDFMQPFYDAIIKHMPFTASMLKFAPVLVVVERVVCNVVCGECDVGNGCGSFQSWKTMLVELDLVFQKMLNETVQKIQACMSAFSPESLCLKNNYFSATEPIIASYISYTMGKHCKSEFFVSLESRVAMFRSEKPISTKGFFVAMMKISELISELLSVFVLRSLLQVAWLINAERKSNELERQKTRTSLRCNKEEDETKRRLEFFEKQTLEFCEDYENLAKEKFVKCKRHYPHIFALSEFLTSWKENDERPRVTTVISSMLFKLMYLFAGGLKSIAADDMQYGVHVDGASLTKKMECADSLTTLMGTKPNLLTEDLALASCLTVEICEWVTVVAVKLFKIYSDKMDGNDAALCATVLRVIYQYMGLLPFGTFCPKNILRWIDLFPLYTLRDCGMRSLLSVYSCAAEQETYIMRPIDVNDFFRSFMNVMSPLETCATTRSKFTTYSVVFVPNFTKDSESVFFEKPQTARCEMLYNLFAQSCSSIVQPTINITKTAKIDLKSRILSSISPHLLQEISNELTSLRMSTYAERTGALLRWLSVDDVRELNRGDVLCVECKVLMNYQAETNFDSELSHLSTSILTVAPFMPMNGHIKHLSSMRQQQVCEKKSSASCENDEFQVVEFNLVITWVYKISSVEQLVVFDKSLEVSSVLDVLSAKLVVYFVPPFFASDSGNLWTNPNFPYDSKNFGWGSFPFVFGWLLGHSLANGVLLRLPIAPLLFRLLRYALKYGVKSQTEHMHPSILTLIDDKLWEQLHELEDSKLKLLIEHASEMCDKNSAANAYALAAARATIALIMNVKNNLDRSLKFWDEVAEGFRSTPLGRSPLLTNCCARVVRNVLCGSTDSKEVNENGFCWEDHFVFLCAPKLKKLSYGMSLLKAVVKCLNSSFTGEKAREVLLFFTGSPLLPPSPFRECIFLTVSSFNNDSFEASNSFNDDLSVQMLPSQWPGHYVLEISGNVERFLFAQRGDDDSLSGVAEWKRLHRKERTRMMAAFHEKMRSLLERATTTGGRKKTDLCIIYGPHRKVKIDFTSDSSDSLLQTNDSSNNFSVS